MWNPCTQNTQKRNVNITYTRTADICMHITVHNCRTHHSTEQFWLSSLLTSWQSSQLRCCPLKKHKSHLTALCQGLPGWAATRRQNQSGFYWSKRHEWLWNQLGHMQVCTSLQTDNHTNTPPLSFLQAGCPSCHPTNSVKALGGKTEIKKQWSTCCIVISRGRIRISTECNSRMVSISLK